MKILYDGFIFSAQRGGGISRYFASIIRRLPVTWTPVVRSRKNPEVVRPEHPRLRIGAFPFDVIKPQILSNRVGKVYFHIVDTVVSYDLFHPTYHFVLPEEHVQRRRCPLVVTVHDMIPEIFSSDLDPTGVDGRAKRSAIEAADAIICVSQNTKRDLQERYKIPDARITVTYLASDINSGMSFGAEAVPDAPYCLFMGNRGIYKNFARVLLAFARVAESWRELVLCVVGEPFKANENELIRALNLKGRVSCLDFVPDSHLAKLYRCSQALLYPSLYEGFGIPPLEAMACGTVVITSNCASLPEVVGDAAIKVNPESIDDIAEAIVSLKDLGSHRNTLIDQGLEQSRKFKWDETVRQTMDIYKSIAS
jgi:glycosyltransferase involved in cell wall biosynthesis